MFTLSDDETKPQNKHFLLKMMTFFFSTHKKNQQNAFSIDIFVFQ